MNWLFSKPMGESARYFQIISIVKERQRALPPGRGVLPVSVQCWLEEYRAEQTLRRDCATLWRQGLLERMGGEGSRKGSRVPMNMAI